MKILIIDPADFIGGAEFFTLDLIAHLPSEYEIVLATNGHPDYLRRVPLNRVVVEKTTLKKLKSNPVKQLFNLYHGLKSLKSIIHRHKPDLIQTNSIRSHILGSILGIRKNTPPLIWMLHDFTFPGYLAGLLARFPRKILTCSQAVKKDIQTKIHPQYWSKVEVLYSGIDVNHIEDIVPEPNLRLKLHLKPETPIIGHVGRIDPWKGQEHLIRSAPDVIAQIPGAHFVFIGDASSYDAKTLRYKKKIQQLVQELNLEDRISFLGFQSNPIALIKQFSLFVHTSTEPEPFGRVILEALAAKIPIIVSNKGGGPTEIVIHEQNGIITYPTDPHALASNIINLLNSPELQQKFINQGLDKLRSDFSFDRMLKHLREVYS